MTTIALIGGTSLLEANMFRDALPKKVETPFGTVTLQEKAGVLFLQRHGLDTYTPPHRINHRANIFALKKAGATGVLALGSVGSLRQEAPPGTVLVPDDFFAPHLGVTFFADGRGHRLPGFDPVWRQTVLRAWATTDLPPPIDGGVYWQTQGPRFETPAEIRFFQPHVHVVGMTIASECVLAGELDLPFAALCMIDNFASGLEAQPLTFERFKRQVRANKEKMINIVQILTEILTS